MITLHRTSTLAATKDYGRAIAWAHEIAACIKQSIGTDVTVEMPVGAHPYQLRWTLKFDNLAAYEAGADALRNDPKYMALFMAGTDIFAHETTNEGLWRTV